MSRLPVATTDLPKTDLDRMRLTAMGPMPSDNSQTARPVGVGMPPSRRTPVRAEVTKMRAGASRDPGGLKRNRYFAAIRDVASIRSVPNELVLEPGCRSEGAQTRSSYIGFGDHPGGSIRSSTDLPGGTIGKTFSSLLIGTSSTTAWSFLRALLTWALSSS